MYLDVEDGPIEVCDRRECHSVTLASRARLIRSFNLRSVADFGNDSTASMPQSIDALSARASPTEIVEQISGLEFEQQPVGIELQWFRPERANVHSAHFRRVQHFAQRPHEGAVDTHQCLMIDRIGLVEHDAYFIVVAFEHFDGALQLVGDVERGDVEQQQDAIASVGEPFENLTELVATIDALLLAGENAGRVDERHSFENIVAQLRANEPIEKSIAEFRQRPKGFRCIDHQGIARHDAGVFVVHDGDEGVSGGLYTYACATSLYEYDPSNAYLDRCECRENLPGRTRSETGKRVSVECAFTLRR